MIGTCDAGLGLAGFVGSKVVDKQFVVIFGREGFASGVFLPQWKLRRPVQEPRVRVHRDETGRCAAIVNESLAPREAELARFDLIERDSGKMTLVFTWAHALMDAVGAEHFLAALGHPET